ncbi:Enamine deaminase RidA, house cleaning of reactive enamine intermediates, YjgF/YER057c/UK114 family [Agromyces sp. CF514]|uniref:RidA family protein n=1 Tax=Agromyces sp. CF514 TaxID=1881031 RepID=UPI0008E51425|nr:Rid family hydrolase [Agromyces sp. CF514]SFR68819.1 Enamine deaminase RidA, house cleaning of reactive enamine intermediates, YjgF/YER057c/UK114 family [Agromyces sp. CF514]
MTRATIEIDGFAHVNPVPAACRIGPFVQSGVLTARDRRTGEMPEDLDTQVVLVFARVREVMAAAGGDVGDILKLTLWVADHRDREGINREWVAMFPDAADRPARMVMAAPLDGGSLVQAELTAVIEQRPGGGIR